MKKQFILAVLLVLATFSLGFAQNEVLEKSVIAGGGGNSSDGTFDNRVTVGQSAIGFQSNGLEDNIAGFWQAFGAPPPSFVYTNLDIGLGSLREAINYANSHLGPDTIFFDIALLGTSISLLSPLPNIVDDSTFIDGDIDFNGTPDIELDGSAAGAGASGLVLNSKFNTVIGLVINRFDAHGIHITGSFNTVLGNYIGTDVTASLDRGNLQNGVYVAGLASFNRVGDGTVMGRNVISGNDQRGIYILNADTTDIIGNFIGTDITGMLAIPNSGNGVEISTGAESNRVGDGTATGGNVISGNGNYGIVIFDNSKEVDVLGNLIGTTADGMAPLANGNAGILVQTSRLISIGNGLAYGRNIISANGGHGIQMLSDDSVRVLGNFIGLGKDGDVPLGNTFEGIVSGGTNILIGDTTLDARNIISNNRMGIRIQSDSTYVINNFIGTDSTGLLPRGNSWDGIRLEGSDNEIGGPNPKERNIISGNNLNGILVSGDIRYNFITGNFIGVDIDTLAMSNQQNGIRIENNASVTDVDSNLIAFNQLFGVEIDGASTDSNSVHLNSIFNNTNGGINITGGAQQNALPPIIQGMLPDSTLFGLAGPNELVHFYADTFNQGKIFLDSAFVQGDGSWSKKIFMPNGMNITALQDSAANTSIFSLPYSPLNPFIQDSMALVAIYDNMGGPTWNNQTNWKTAAPLSSWFGVTILNNRVSGLVLPGNNLTGVFEPQLTGLDSLRVLNLSSNAINTVIPVDIDKLSVLEQLILSTNNIPGPLPPALGNMTTLQNLSIYQNPIGGIIPDFIGNLINLTTLYLRENNLSGIIPDTLQNLTNLTLLGLDYNALTGSLPNSLTTLPSLQNLYLSGNSLVGAIPANIWNMISLTTLRLDGNGFTGTLPIQMGNLTNLEVLTLSVNPMTGVIPAEIGNLTALVSFEVEGCNFSGPLPANIWTLTNLQNLFLAGNAFGGTIPTAIGNLTAMRQLFMDNTGLSGTIPLELGNLNQMIYLRLNNNNLTGTIPDTLQSMTNMQSLYLSSNQFTGAIPAGFSNFTQMTGLQINDNLLDEMPLNWSALTNLNTLVIGGNRFTFEDLEPIVSAGAPATFIYVPQDSVGAVVDTLLMGGDNYVHNFTVGGTANVYNWDKDGGFFAATQNLNIAGAGIGDIGQYIASVTNPNLPGLTINSRPINVDVNSIPVVTLPITDKIIAEDAVNVFVEVMTNVFTDPDGPIASFTVNSFNNNVIGILSNDSLYISALPEFNGKDTLRVEAFDPGGLSVADTFEVLVSPINDLPVVILPIADISIPEDTLNYFVEYLPNVFDDPDGSIVNFNVVSQGNILIKLSNDSLFLDTTPEFNGTDSVLVTAFDNLGSSVNDTFEVFVKSINDIPQLSVLPDLLFNEDEQDSIKIVDFISDADDPFKDLNITIEVIDHQLKTDAVTDLLVSFNDLSGFMRFVPKKDVKGSFTVRFAVSDGKDTSSSDTIKVSVTAVNDAPVLSVINDLNIEIDIPFNLTLNFVDVDNDVLLWSDDTNLFDVSDAGQISFLPTAAQRGEYDITVTLSDGSLSDTRTFHLTIYGDAEAPIAEEIFISEEDSTTNHGLSILVVANDTLGGILGNTPEELTYRYSIKNLSTSDVITIDRVGEPFAQFYPLPTGSFEIKLNVIDVKGNGAFTPVAKFDHTILPSEFDILKETWYMLTLSRFPDSDANLRFLENAELYTWFKGEYLDIRNAKIKPGRAFWYFSSEPLNVNFDKSNHLIADSAVVILQRGWNQIGNPYEMNIRQANITIGRISIDARQYSLSEAIADSLIYSDAFIYLASDTTDVDFYRAEPLKIRNYNPWQGIWVFAAHDGIQFKWHKEPQNVKSAFVLNKSEIAQKTTTSVDNNFSLSLKGKDTEKITLDFDGGFSMGRLPQLGSSPVSKLALKNNLMLYPVPTLGELETRSYPLYLRAGAGEELVAEFRETNLEGAYIILEKSQQVIDLFDENYVLASDIDENGYLVVTTNPDWDADFVPFTIDLGQNYPNPFNGATKIEIAIPYSAEGKNVKLELFNILGQRVRTLLNKNLSAGWHTYTWNGANDAGTAVASGIYFYRMIIGSKIMTKKSIYMK